MVKQPDERVKLVGWWQAAICILQRPVTGQGSSVGLNRHIRSLLKGQEGRLYQRKLWWHRTSNPDSLRLNYNGLGRYLSVNIKYFAVERGPHIQGQPAHTL